jgi:hypothetical protein
MKEEEYAALRDAEFICASCGTNHTGRGGLLMKDGWGCEDPYCQY